MSETLLKSQKVGIRFCPNDKTFTGTSPLLFNDTTSDNGWDDVNQADNGEDYVAMLATPGSVKPNPGTTVSDLKYTSAASIFPESSRVKIDASGALPSIDFEIFGTQSVLTSLLILSLHKYTDAAEIISILPQDGVIDFPNLPSANTGYVGTVAGYDLNGDGFILQRAVVNNLTITIDNVGSADARLMKVSGQLVGSDLLTNQSMGGVFDASETSIYNDSGIANPNDGFTLDLTVNSIPYSNLCWRRTTITITNNFMSDCFNTDGSANNYKRENPEITYSIDVPYNANTKTFLNSFQSGDSVVFNLKNGNTVAGTQILDIYFPEGYMTESPEATEKEYKSISLKAKAVKPSAGWGSYVFKIGLPSGDTLS